MPEYRLQTVSQTLVGGIATKALSNHYRLLLELTSTWLAAELVRWWIKEELQSGATVTRKIQRVCHLIWQRPWACSTCDHNWMISRAQLDRIIKWAHYTKTLWTRSMLGVLRKVVRQLKDTKARVGTPCLCLRVVQLWSTSLLARCSRRIQPPFKVSVIRILIVCASKTWARFESKKVSQWHQYSTWWVTKINRINHETCYRASHLLWHYRWTSTLSLLSSTSLW